MQEIQPLALSENFLSKKGHLVLDTVRQDVITPLAPGETPGGFERSRKA
jgi:hypothetical protein